MKYRPPEWKNPYSDYLMNGRKGEILESFDKFNKERGMIYEAGADAMLEALRKEGKHYEKGSTDEAWWQDYEEGFTLVFISDDDKEG